MYRIALPADTEKFVCSKQGTFLPAKCHEIRVASYNLQMLCALAKANPGVAAYIKSAGTLTVVGEPIHTINHIGSIILQAVIPEDGHVVRGI